MNKRHYATLMLVSLLAVSAIVPASHASTIRVVLNPASNEATVDAYINSSLSISANSTSIIGQNLIKDILSSSTAGNLTINSTSQGNTSLAFEILNNSISERDPAAQLNSLSLGYQRTVENSTSNGEVTFFANSSLEIVMKITGIFSNNSANLTWRSFTTNQSLPMNGTDVNKVNFNNSYFASSNSVNTVNMSVFAKSLVQWNKTYDPVSNTTTFLLNAGKTIDLSYSGSTIAGGFNLTYTLDPSYSISAPGYDTASSDSIVIGNPPASNHALYYGMGAVLVLAGVIMMYVRRRGVR